MHPLIAGGALRRVLLALLLVSPVLAGPARAAETETLEQLIEAYEALDKANDVEGRVRLLPLICRRAAEATFDPKDDEARRTVEAGRKQARALCRRALVHARRVLIIAGLEGYGILALPGSSQDLKTYARRQDSERRPQEVRLAALAAWGRIHDIGSHDVLIDHLRLPSHDPEAEARALAAVAALRAYRELPRGMPRFELLRDVMLLFAALRDASGLNTGFVTSADSTHWYAVLETPLVLLFNHLTEQGLTRYADCAAWWRDNRHAVKAGRG